MKVPEAGPWGCRAKLALKPMHLSYRTKQKKEEIVNNVLTHTPSPCRYIAKLLKVGGMCSNYVEYYIFELGHIKKAKSDF